MDRSSDTMNSAYGSSIVPRYSHNSNMCRYGTAEISHSCTQWALHCESPTNICNELGIQAVTAEIQTENNQIEPLKTCCEWMNKNVFSWNFLTEEPFIFLSSDSTPRNQNWLNQHGKTSLIVWQTEQAVMEDVHCKNSTDLKEAIPPIPPPPYPTAELPNGKHCQLVTNSLPKQHQVWPYITWWRW